MIIRSAGRTTQEKILLGMFYLLTVFWILTLLAPFAWMVSSSFKDRVSIFELPPRWIPRLPETVSVTLDYGAKLPPRSEVIKDAALATWMIWDEYGRETIWGFDVVCIADGKKIFQSNAPSYKVKHQKDAKLIAITLNPELVTKKAEVLISGISHEFLPSEAINLPALKGRATPKEQTLKVFLERKGLKDKVASVRLSKTPRRLFDSFISAWLYGFETASFKRSFGRFIFNSIFVTSSVILSQIFISSLAAYSLSRLLGTLSSRLLLLFFLATMMIPPLLLFMPLYLMMKSFPFSQIPFTGIKLPTINLLDPELPANLHPWIASWLYPLLSYLPLILPYTAWGFSVLLFKGFFDQLPEELIEAARLDGASEFRIFTRVVFPLSKPVFSVMALWTFLAVWQDFMWPYIISIVQPQEFWTYTVALYYKQNAAAYANEVMALAILASIPTVAIFTLFQRFIEGGIVWTGLKG